MHHKMSKTTLQALACAIACILACVGCVKRGPWHPIEGPSVWCGPDQLAQPVARTHTQTMVMAAMAGVPLVERGLRLPDGGAVSLWDLGDAASDALLKHPLPTNWPMTGGISSGGKRIDVRRAPFRIFLVSIRPTIFLMVPSQAENEPEETDRATEEERHRWPPDLAAAADTNEYFEVLVTQFQNTILLRTTLPGSPEVWYLAPDFQPNPTRIPDDSRGLSIRWSDQVLELRREGEQWITHRRQAAPR